MTRAFKDKYITYNYKLVTIRVYILTKYFEFHINHNRRFY